jgi:O-antigen ligase
MEFSLQIVVGFACCVRDDGNRALKRLSVVAMAIIAINVLFSAAFHNLAASPGGYTRVYEGALRGIFQHKNALGAIVALCVTSILATATRAGQMRLTFTHAISLFAAVGLLALSRSATGLATCAIAVLIYIVEFGVIRSAPLNLRVSIVGLVATTVIIGVACADQLGDLTASVLGRDPTFTGRTLLWDFALKMADLRPTFGYGFAGFWQSHLGPGSDLVKIGLWEVYAAHNGFIESYLSGGAVGFVLTVGVFVYLLVKSVFALVLRPEDPRSFFALCVALQIATQNLSESDFPNALSFAGTLLTVAMLVLQTASQSRTIPPRQNPGWRSETAPLDGMRGAPTFDDAEVHNDSVEIR